VDDPLRVEHAYLVLDREQDDLDPPGMRAGAMLVAEVQRGIALARREIGRVEPPFERCIVQQMAWRSPAGTY
jgi:hypothetical protein